MKEINDFFNIDELSDYLSNLSESEKIAAIRKKIDTAKAVYDNIKTIMDAAKQADDSGYEDLKNEVMSQVVTATLTSLLGDRCANQILNKVKSPELNKAIKIAKKI